MPFVTSHEVADIERMWKASCIPCTAPLAGRMLSYYLLSPTMLPNLPLACIGFAAQKNGVVTGAVYGVSSKVNYDWQSYWVLFEYRRLQEGMSPERALKIELLHLPGDCNVDTYLEDRITFFTCFAAAAPERLLSKGERKAFLANAATLKARLGGYNPPPQPPTLVPSFQPQPR